jgi:hypothetical protein
MCGYVACGPDVRGATWNHDNLAHRSRNHTLYDIPPIRFVFQVTQEDLKLPDDGRLQSKHVETGT